VLTVAQLKALLKLEPLTMEGGYFSETYRSSETIPVSALPARYSSAKPFSTAIYFLLTPETCSRLHRLPSDEIYHFYLGDPVELVQLYPDGSGQITVLGQELEKGMRPQHLVTKGTWQGSRLSAGGRYALLGTTVAPGFAACDFEKGDRQTLLRDYPAFHDLIGALTR
jgi:predicted cupin superfamily sugar epimerase